jgi:hypothetical protein
MASDPTDRADLPGYHVEITTDPAAFLAVAGAHLAADPVVSTVIATVTGRHQQERAAGLAPPADRPQWWAVVRDAGGEIAGLAMRTARTPPHPVFVLPMAHGAALALAVAVHARGEVIGGLNGSLPAAQVCAAELARRQGDRVEVALHTRLFELGRLVPPRGVPGGLREATLDDADLVREWWLYRFPHDADVQAGRSPQAHGDESTESELVQRRIESGAFWFWLDEAGERVNLTGASPSTFGVARVGPVYTPPRQRRKGYAGAAVAAVSRRFLDGGARVCLYTDQANPTSNGIYLAIGFRPVVDQVHLRLVGGGTRPGS